MDFPVQCPAQRQPGAEEHCQSGPAETAAVTCTDCRCGAVRCRGKEPEPLQGSENISYLESGKNEIDAKKVKTE